ncbi:MAG TPA: outer membrane beta-barrel protein, partial [Candidatus Binatus sp.]|nr:outer membrane beta-barrel protein [Candidatus Binatus sp.]
GMRQGKVLLCWAIIVGLMALPTGQAAAADRYVGLYGGLTIPQPLQDVRGIESSSGVTLSNLKLAQSAILGAKLGFFRSPKSWLGVETEFFYTNPHMKQQNITFTPPALRNFAEAHIRMATWAVNLIARYPGERFQPYAGVGPGIFWARISGAHTGTTPPDIGTASHTSAGLNALAGLRFALTERLALFGEYKYQQAAFNFGSNVTLYTLYQAHSFVGGLSLQF